MHQDFFFIKSLSLLLSRKPHSELFQTGGIHVNRRAQIEVRHSFTLPMDTSIVKYRHLSLVHFIFSSVQPMITNFTLLRCEYGSGILSLNRLRRTSVVLLIERSLYVESTKIINFLSHCIVEIF